MKYLSIIIFIFFSNQLNAQELYVFTEPASNMAAKSLGIRLGYKQFKMNHTNSFDAYRFNPEIMIGLNKKLMFHLSGYASNMFQSNLKLEGGSIYAKYRFYSNDDIHKHFRLAAFAKLSVINNPNVIIHIAKHNLPDGNGGTVLHEEEQHIINNDIELDGTNSGISSGIIATKLVNRLALSSTVGHSYRLNNISNKREVIVPWNAINYSFSAGYLFYPKEYINYKQTNINFYAEFLGSAFEKNKGSYLDFAPSVQFIINSIARIDLGYRTQLYSNLQRMNKSSFLIRAEYNFLNIFSKK